MEARTVPFDRGKCKRRAGREQHPLRIYDRASPPWRSSAGFFRLHIHFITHASSAVRLQCIRPFDDPHPAAPCLVPPHFPLPIPSSALQHRPVARAVVSPFGALRLSDVLPEFTQKLTGNAVRSTSMNRAWVCGGDYDGAEHLGSGCGALRDSMPAQSLVQPPRHSSWPTCAAVSPFGDLRLSDVLPEFNQKLTGNAVRSTSMNRAWVCGGDYDGAEHPGSGCGALRDYTSTLSPPPSRDTCPTHAHAPPPTFRMILRLLRTWTRSDCGGTVHSCDYTRGLAAPTHTRLATARAVALL